MYVVEVHRPTLKVLVIADLPASAITIAIVNPLYVAPCSPADCDGTCVSVAMRDNADAERACCGCCL